MRIAVIVFISLRTGRNSEVCILDFTGNTRVKRSEIFAVQPLVNSATGIYIGKTTIIGSTFGVPHMRKYSLGRTSEQRKAFSVSGECWPLRRSFFIIMLCKNKCGSLIAFFDIKCCSDGKRANCSRACNDRTG